MTAEGFDFLFTRWPGLFLRDCSFFMFSVFLKKYSVISKWQVLWACMAGYTWYCTALTQGGSVILQQTPKHRCKTALDDTIEGFSFEDGLEFSPSSCEKYPDSWTAKCLHGETLSACFSRQSANLTTAECDSGFIYDDELFESTFVTEFDLVCERSYVNTVSTRIGFRRIFDIFWAS